MSIIISKAIGAVAMAITIFMIAKESLKINYDRLQTIIDDLDKKLNEIDK